MVGAKLLAGEMAQADRLARSLTEERARDPEAWLLAAVCADANNDPARVDDCLQPLKLLQVDVADVRKTLAMAALDDDQMAATIRDRAHSAGPHPEGVSHPRRHIFPPSPAAATRTGPPFVGRTERRICARAFALVAGKNERWTISLVRLKVVCVVSVAPYHPNRAVHLARRDAFFERAMDLLCQPVEALGTEARAVHIRHVHDALRKAHDHAAFALKGTTPLQQELDFVRFLELKARNTESALAMLQHQLEFEKEEGFLSKFLAACREETMLPAQQYRRRAEDILQGMWHLVRRAQSNYTALSRLNQDALPADQKGRYRRAYRSFQNEALSRFPNSTFGSGQRPPQAAAARR
jgi:hypothetical protein